MEQREHILPELEDWPINLFYRHRDRVVRNLAKAIKKSVQERENATLESQLSQVVYAEKLRSKANPLKVDPPEENAYWKKQSDLLSSAGRDEVDSDKIHQDLLDKVAARYAEEIPGDFKPKTFKFARKALTILFKLIYNPFYKKGQGIFWGNREKLLDKFHVEGPLDHIRKLFDKGTVVVLPTHFSNLDSILVGFGIDMRTGLPAFSYGAGLNLYDYEILAYLMSRLGAYKIDRRKKNTVYLQSLKEFSKIGLSEGLNSIFFAGGTRSRNGMMETEPKLGLLNTLVETQNEFINRNQDKKIIIVPLVISYHFVLEADSLIDQFLRRTGKQNYIAGRRKKSKKMGVFKMLRRLMSSDSDVTLSFGHPIDIFGHQMDANGNSLKKGKPIDIKDYFRSDGQLNHDPQRNRVYTRHLADALVESYKRENVILTSHIATFVAFQMFKKRYVTHDLYALINLPDDYLNIPTEDFFLELEKVRSRIKEMVAAQEVKISKDARDMSHEELLIDACKHLRSFHAAEPLKIVGKRVRTENHRLLYYYHNRLEGYQLDLHVENKRVQPVQLTESLY